MIRLIFFIILIISKNSFSQNIIRQGVKINYMESGNSFTGQLKTNYKTYSIQNDTCVNNQILYFINELDSFSPSLYTKQRNAIRYDSIAKKIYYYSNLKNHLYFRELYDFNLNIGDINMYDLTLIKLEYKLILGKMRKIFYFKKPTSCYPKTIYDIWIEGLGSICQNYLNPTGECASDGITYSYCPKINIGNLIELKNIEYQIPHANFSSISKIESCDLPFKYISYKCNGTIDTVLFYNKCVTDSNYVINATLSVDNSKIYNCFDTIHYKLIIQGNDSSKLIKWDQSIDTLISYPNSTQKQLFYNSVSIKNKDSSCEVYLQTPYLNVNCSYCDNPINNPVLSLSLISDSIKCYDTLKPILNSTGQKDSLWFYYLNFNNSLHGYQDVQFNYGNRICIKKSITKKIFVDCSSQSIINDFYEDKIKIKIENDKLILVSNSISFNHISYSIFNTLGKELVARSINRISNKIELDEFNLKIGLFILIVYDINKNIIYKKIIAL